MENYSELLEPCRSPNFVSNRLVLQDLKMLIIGAEIESNVSTGIFFHQILFTLKAVRKSKWFEWVANTRWRAVDRSIYRSIIFFQEFLIFLLTFLLKYIIIITVKKRS